MRSRPTGSSSPSPAGCGGPSSTLTCAWLGWTRRGTCTLAGGEAGGWGAVDVGAGALGAGIETPVFNFTRLDAGDLDGDGVGDLVTDVPGNAWRLQLYKGLGDGGFGAPVLHDGFNFEDLEIADVSGDGRADVITRPTGQPPRVDVYLAK